MAVKGFWQNRDIGNDRCDFRSSRFDVNPQEGACGIDEDGLASLLAERFFHSSSNSDNAAIRVFREMMSAGFLRL
jgi:hypothetical protein